MIAAGGRGERVGAPSPKQFAPLGDRPLLFWSLDVLDEAGCDPLILVVPAECVDRAQALTNEKERVLVVEGGLTRQESVANGLRHVDTENVFVHDAARPFIDVALVHRLADALGSSDGVIPVVPVGETVKEINGSWVVQTVDRSNLVLSQTPQLFSTEPLRRAHERAADEGYVSTDDAELIERYIGEVETVPGSRRNIKLTYAEDFELAESMLGTL